MEQRQNSKLKCMASINPSSFRFIWWIFTCQGALRFHHQQSHLFVNVIGSAHSHRRPARVRETTTHWATSTGFYLATLRHVQQATDQIQRRCTGRGFFASLVWLGCEKWGLHRTAPSKKAVDLGPRDVELMKGITIHRLPISWPMPILQELLWCQPKPFITPQDT